MKKNVADRRARPKTAAKKEKKLDKSPYLLDISI